MIAIERSQKKLHLIGQMSLMVLFYRLQKWLPTKVLFTDVYNDKTFVYRFFVLWIDSTCSYSYDAESINQSFNILFTDFWRWQNFHPSLVDGLYTVITRRKRLGLKFCHLQRSVNSTLSRTTDAQRGNCLHCTAENSIPIPNL